MANDINYFGSNPHEFDQSNKGELKGTALRSVLKRNASIILKEKDK